VGLVLLFMSRKAPTLRPYTVAMPAKE